MFAYTVNYNDSYTDEEIDASFAQAKALGAETIASSMTLRMAERVAPFADRHKFYVALHGHSDVANANSLSTPDTFLKGMAFSRYFHTARCGCEASIWHRQTQRPTRPGGVPYHQCMPRQGK